MFEQVNVIYWNEIKDLHGLENASVLWAKS